jgi:hypothetical protein
MPVYAQFCHGAVGLVLLAVRCFELTRITRFLTAAREAAEVVWTRGLLKKGVGLCHGLAGNAYAFLALFRATREPQWLYRAYCFAIFPCNNDRLLQHLWNTPDVPNSLANGRSGAICLLVDVIATHDWVIDGGVALTQDPRLVDNSVLREKSVEITNRIGLNKPQPADLVIHNNPNNRNNPDTHFGTTTDIPLALFPGFDV